MVWLGIAGGIFFADTILKGWAEKHLSEKIVREVFGSRILLRRLHNSGMACSFGESHPEMVKKGTLGLWIGIFGGFLWLLRQPGRWISKLGTAFVVGGGASNLADRLGKESVTDYFSLNVKWEKLRRLVFNLSDIFIFLGSILMVLGGATGKRKNHESKK